MSLVVAWLDGLTCRRVPAGVPAAEQRRHRGVVPAAGAQRTAPADRQPGRQGDPQLRPGGPGGPGGTAAAGRLHQPVPGAAAGSGRRGGWRGGSARLPADGRGVGAGPAVGAAGDRGRDPPGRRRPAAGRRGRRAGDLRAGSAAGAGAGLQAGRHPLGGRAGVHRGLPGVLRRRRLPGHGLPARRAGGDRLGDLLLGGAPAEPGRQHRLRGHHLHLLGDGGGRRAGRGRPPRTRTACRRRRAPGCSGIPRTTATTCPRS